MKKRSSGKKSAGQLVTKRQGVPAATSDKQYSRIAAQTVLSHREFVTSLSGNSANFVLLGLSAMTPGYDINPGVAQLFPWASKIAQAYEKYRFTSLKFELVPRNPTTASGAVYMAVDYDYDDIPSSNVTELMSNHGAVASDVWTPTTLRVDCARMNRDVPYRYVDEEIRWQSTAARMVYGGYLMVGIAGTAATVAFDLYVDYSVVLELPALVTTSLSVTYTYPAAQVLPAGTATAVTGLPGLSAIRSVLAGINGTPTLGTMPAGSPAYALDSSSRGTLSLVAALATAGAPPSTYATDTTFNALVYDAFGTLLANLNAVAGVISSVFPSQNAAGSWATNGATSFQDFVVDLPLLRAAYPAATYLLPVITSTAGRTLSVSTSLLSRYTKY